jgi:F-type H+-transporting ATPase subunit gamma
MSKRRHLESHRKQLVEIREIMNSMKNLAYLESRKLSQRLGSQLDAVITIEKAAADLIHFYPEIKPTVDESSPVILLIGSERGFCADYNEALVEYLEQNVPEHLQLFAVGDKLSQRLESDERVVTRLVGASTMDEAGDIINRIIESLDAMQLLNGNRLLRLMYHEPAQKQVVMKNILPAFADLLSASEQYATAPDINLPPTVLLNELAEHYLLALLYNSLYAALMAENLSRIDHMENALQRIDEKTLGLTQQCNILRQEEIIEEIEIILLNTRLASKRHEKRLEK